MRSPPPDTSGPAQAHRQSDSATGPTNSTRADTHALLDLLNEALPNYAQISSANIALLFMIIALGLLLLPDELKQRLKHSWLLFWPPWQDRSLHLLTSTDPPPAPPPASANLTATPSAESSKPASDPSQISKQQSAEKREVNAREAKGSERPSQKDVVGTANRREEYEKAKRAEIDLAKEQDRAGKQTAEGSKTVENPSSESARKIAEPPLSELSRLEEEGKAKEAEKYAKEKAAREVYERAKAAASAEQRENADQKADVAATAAALGSAISPRLGPPSTSKAEAEGDVSKDGMAKPLNLEKHTNDDSKPTAKATACLTNPHELKQMQKQLVRCRQAEDEAKEAIQAETARGDGVNPVEMQVLRVKYEKARTKRKELEVALAGMMADSGRSSSTKTALGASAPGRAAKPNTTEPGSGGGSSLGKREIGKSDKTDGLALSSRKQGDGGDQTSSETRMKIKGGASAETESATPTAKPSAPQQSSSSSSTPRAATSASTMEKASTPPASMPEADPLMAGDYRPLKSALKKSKKKPRQSKNIQHNYFMTMRGHHPSLVPFPHGFHPPPTALRHTLWWKNIPKDADHIMAPPPIAKIPDNGPEDEEVPKAPARSASEAKQEDTKVREKEKGTEKDAARMKGPEKETDNAKEKEKESRKGDTDKVSKEGRSSSKPSEAGGSEKREALSSEEKEKLAHREAEKARMKASGETKEPSKHDAGDKEEAKEKEKEKAKLAAAQKERERAKAKAMAAAEADARSKPQTGAPTSAVASLEAVDPQLQKATSMSQGMLCALLYFVHPQLALVLLGYFVWRYLEQKSKTNPVPPSIAMAQGEYASERLKAENSTAISSGATAAAAASKERSREKSAQRERDTTAVAKEGSRSMPRKADMPSEERTTASDKEKDHEATTRQLSRVKPEMQEVYERLKAFKKEQARLEAKGKLTDELKAKYLKEQRKLEKILADMSASQERSSLPDVPNSKGKEKMTEQEVKHLESKSTSRPASAYSSGSNRDRMRDLYERLKSLKKDQAKYEEEGKLTDEMKFKFKKKRQQLEEALASLQAKEKQSQTKEMTPERVEEMQRAREEKKRARAMAEKAKLGQGSSGLSSVEKDALRPETGNDPRLTQVKRSTGKARQSVPYWVRERE